MLSDPSACVIPSSLVNPKPAPTNSNGEDEKLEGVLPTNMKWILPRRKKSSGLLLELVIEDVPTARRDTKLRFEA